MPEYTLHSYFRSSCSARLRIALNLKNIPYELVSVNLLKGEQASNAHLALNPCKTVPVLIHHKPDGNVLTIAQSVAAMEYLEERHPDAPALLPSAADMETRALVRTLVNVVVADIQPLSNMRSMRRVGALGGDTVAWNCGVTADGLAAYEAMLTKTAGRYSVGDAITMADVCLMPAVWNAQRWEVDMAPFTNINRIVADLQEQPAFAKAYYFVQPDCPEELRKK